MKKFDSDVFVSGFIKIYSDTLGLDTDRVLALYRRGNGHIYITNEKKNKKKNNKPKKNIFLPKNIVISLITIFLIAIVAYIGYEIFLFQNPPEINITSPSNNITLDEESITIEGTTINSTYISILDEKIEVKEDGSFSY